MNEYSHCVFQTESEMETEGVWTGETEHNGTTPLIMSITALGATGVYLEERHKSVSPAPATPPSASRSTATTNNYISDQHENMK